MVRSPSATAWLQPFAGVTFDLFGTLVRLDEDYLPRLSLNGIIHPTLLAAPLRNLAENRPGLDLAMAVSAYIQAVDETRRWFREAEDRELPPHWTFERCLVRLGIDDADLAQSLAASLTEATAAAARAVDCAIPLLTELRVRGYGLGLLSNLFDPAAGLALISSLRLAPYFDTVVFSGAVGWRKPNPRIFRAAAEGLGMAPSALLHVGDELRTDIWGAEKAGFRSVWLDPGSMPLECDHEPYARVASLDEFAALALG